MTTPDKNGVTLPSEIEIAVNLDAFMIGDLHTLDRGQDRSPKALVGLLERVVVGGARHLPLRSIRLIGAQLRLEMEALALATEEIEVIELPPGVTVDADLLTIGDLELLEGEKGKVRSAEKIIALLDRVVVGATVEGLSVKYLSSLSAELKAGMEAMNDLGN